MSAPELSAVDEASELRAELAATRAELRAAQMQLAALNGTTPPTPQSIDRSSPGWTDRISFHDPGYGEEGGRSFGMNRLRGVGARLKGITSDRDAVQSSIERPELPKPTADEGQLQRDFLKWGYCLVKDAMSPEQVATAAARLQDQAAAEVAAGVSTGVHPGGASPGAGRSSQLVMNMVTKGEVFRDVIALEPRAAQRGEMIERLLRNILGPQMILSSSHGSLVTEGGGLQEIHQDQGSVPLPHPPYPLVSLLIWCYTDFSKENGGTYLVPGSHVDDQGRNRITPDGGFEELVPGNIVALTCPAGTCMITDGRILHSGGLRTAPGWRLAQRAAYTRGHMRQQENPYLNPPEFYDKCSVKLRALLGWEPHYGFGMVDGRTPEAPHCAVPVGELSLSRPDELKQKFSALEPPHAYGRGFLQAPPRL